MARQNFFENLLDRKNKKQKTSDAENQTKIQTTSQETKKLDRKSKTKPTQPLTKPKSQLNRTSEPKKTSKPPGPKENKTKQKWTENLPKIDKYLAVLKTNHPGGNQETENQTTKPPPLVNHDTPANQPPPPPPKKKSENQPLEPGLPKEETKPMKKLNLIQEKIKFFSSSTPPKLPRNENHHPLTKPEETHSRKPPEPTRLEPTQIPEQVKIKPKTDSEASQETKPQKQNKKPVKIKTSTPKTRARTSIPKAETPSLAQPDIKLFLAKKIVACGTQVAAAATNPNISHCDNKSETNSATQQHNYSLGNSSLNAPTKPNLCRAAKGKPEDVKPTIIGQIREESK